MSLFSKIALTGILAAMIFIPGLDAVIALPALAALGYVWGFAPTTK
ncbi:MAG TPA: hypothetical protein VNV43_00225 [Candidatus Acidoferrales bacterium]|jgi:hypothetical protein|nr:hypothetical protein [Candidatus Acidoferrales bacterium]